ncbi:response regulator [Bdellovibrio sp. HCB288]|uniref:response regulator n=1 Tax=Bdellovibrio sp. HCB288 TaxID=3394355 RepID=UPI0039B5AC27
MFPNTTKFLIVDDFSTMRKIIKKVLSELGYTNVEEADDGKTALPMIQAAHDAGKPYEFIISDWNMPGMQGIDLLKACKADPRFKATPFMLVTAESEQKHILEAAKAGVSDYVVKPFNSQTLKGKMERVWAKHSAGQKAA